MTASLTPICFTSYQTTQGSAHIGALLEENQPQAMLTAPQSPGNPLPPPQRPMTAALLAETPFYAESGGQIGDCGWLSSPEGMFQVMDTQRPISGPIVHWDRMTDGNLKLGSQMSTQVDDQRRADIRENHSATHLLHRALKDLLGESVVQQGSLVEPERLRFDFNFQRAMKKDEVEQIDQTVNAWIRDNHPVSSDLLPLDQARRSGAMALFGEKYPDPVRVVSMGTSKELCGGTHVASMGQIGVYVTTQEISSAADIRRIEALMGRGAEAYLMSRKRTADTLASRLPTSPDMLEQRIDQLTTELSVARKARERLHREAARDEALLLAETALTVQDSLVVAASVKAPDLDTLRAMNDHIQDHLQANHHDRIVILLAAPLDDRATFIVMVSPPLVQLGVQAGKIAQIVAERLGVRGGGRPESGQGGGRSVDRLATVVAEVPALVVEQLTATSAAKR